MSSTATTTVEYHPTAADYAAVAGVLLVFGSILAVLTWQLSAAEVRSEALLGPIIALFGLAAVVWLLMVIARNYAILEGIASADYYAAYEPAKVPVDWVERPARAFNNLMQVPTLFYVVCLLMLVTGPVDRAQVALAWVFVALRAVHALAYIGWNRGPYRFTSWMAGCITLGVIWTRFAAASWHLFGAT